MMQYVVQTYLNGRNGPAFTFGEYECADEAIEVAELAYGQTGELFTVDTYDTVAGKFFDTIYVCGAK